MDNYNYQALANEIISRGINMFESFDDWTKGAFALSNLGEAGREIFKSISMLSDKYNEVENDRKFTNALRTNRKISIATFIYMCRSHGIDTNKFFNHSPVDVIKPQGTVTSPPKEDKEPLSIFTGYVTRRLDKHLTSDLVRFLKSLLIEDDRIREAVKNYRLGVTKEGHVIYWYIDKDGIVRMGKIMAYQPDGHRDQSTVPESFANELLKCGKIRPGYVLKKTLFGEHLLCLPENAHKTVCIVESEKTAVICSICFSNLLWMATGSAYNLQGERMSAVKDRHVILFPDTDGDCFAYRQWTRNAEELNRRGWNIQVSDYLELTATTEERLRKIDIADLLVEELKKEKKQGFEKFLSIITGEDLAVVKRNEVIEALKAQCSYFSADEVSVERIGSISYQDMVFDVKLMNEYHYRYLVLSYEIEKGEHSSFSDEDACKMNERFICGKCFLTKEGVRLIIGFPILGIDGIGKQVEASIKTMCVMVHGIRH